MLQLMTIDFTQTLEQFTEIIQQNYNCLCITVQNCTWFVLQETSFCISSLTLPENITTWRPCGQSVHSTTIRPMHLRNRALWISITPSWLIFNRPMMPD